MKKDKFWLEYDSPEEQYRAFRKTMESVGIREAGLVSAYLRIPLMEALKWRSENKKKFRFSDYGYFELQSQKIFDKNSDRIKSQLGKCIIVPSNLKKFFAVSPFSSDIINQKLKELDKSYLVFFDEDICTLHRLYSIFFYDFICIKHNKTGFKERVEKKASGNVEELAKVIFYLRSINHRIIEDRFRNNNMIIDLSNIDWENEAKKLGIKGFYHVGLSFDADDEIHKETYNSLFFLMDEFVLCHEISHHILGHTSQEKGDETLLDNLPNWSKVWLGSDLNYFQKNELKADAMALLLMVGHNPKKEDFVNAINGGLLAITVMAQLKKDIYRSSIKYPPPILRYKQLLKIIMTFPQGSIENSLTSDLINYQMIISSHQGYGLGTLDKEFYKEVESVPK